MKLKAAILRSAPSGVDSVYFADFDGLNSRHANVTQINGKKFAWSWEFPDPVLASYMNHATDTRIISSRVGLSLPGLLA